ncbi:MAG: four helix bundle protein [Chlorobi bacterium]|nr:four helix bundle protein [Chlorobiota bacterium]
MSGYENLEIYQMAFDYAIEIHHASLKLPQFELFEQGSQIRRSSKSIKDQISEGYGRRRYKADFIKYLIYAHASCDELKGQLKMLTILYPNIKEFAEYQELYQKLSIKINNYIQYVEKNWRT